jgi:hypothetical protein
MEWVTRVYFQLTTTPAEKIITAAMCKIKKEAHNSPEKRDGRRLGALWK